MLEALASTQGNRVSPLVFKLMCIFQEKHRDGNLHYHVGLLAATCFRFAVFKRYIQDRWGLASHWSCSHDGYSTVVRYGHMPSPKKPSEELDASPLLWSATGSHPPLSQASTPTVSALGVAKRREEKTRQRAQDGKAEARFRDFDLWPIVVRENFAPDESSADRVVSYAKRCGGHAMVEFCFTNYGKLNDLVAKCWQFEKVEEHVFKASKTRISFLEEAARQTCCCDGRWTRAALQLFETNNINPSDWCSAMLTSFRDGRSKGTLVCHAGVEGNEGKSWLLEPIRSVFGEALVFTSPPKCGFPLLNLEQHRIVLLDDWRFNESVVSYNLQLLWFEGKPIVIARPQNQSRAQLPCSRNVIG